MASPEALYWMSIVRHDPELLFNVGGALERGKKDESRRTDSIYRRLGMVSWGSGSGNAVHLQSLLKS